MDSPKDELWQLLEEIHIRGEAMKEEMQTMQMQTLPALPALPADAATTTSPVPTAPPGVAASPSKTLERDVHHLDRKQMDAQQELFNVICILLDRDFNILQQFPLSEFEIRLTNSHWLTKALD